jgi:two-component system, cell cycle response regulator
MRVLIAHEEASVRASARGVLEPLGHDVHDCGDATDALAACAAWEPDVALVDAELCKRDGLALLSAIKSDSAAYRTSVILILDGAPGIDEAMGDLRRGAHDFLVGPDVLAAELVARVESAGRTKQLQEELLGQAQRLEQLVFEDPLTGLLNRRAILAQLDALISGARRHQRELSVLMLDIDHFKSFNDSHGHPVGDKVLVTVAHRLRERLRTEDWLGRLGGEEFLAVLPDTAEDEAARVAEDLRAAVEDTFVETAGKRVGITVSIGWATADDDVAESLVHKADEALYAAKEAGRNAVRGRDRPATLRDRP